MPLAWNALICCSGAVSQAASSAASFGCFDCVGTVRYEPPQLPPPPGKAAVTAHLPAFSGPACSLITPSIQAGHTFVANAPCLKPVFHSLLNAVSLADSPLATASVTLVQASLMPWLPSTASLSSVPR